jgi:hypothetical protein
MEGVLVYMVHINLNIETKRKILRLSLTDLIVNFDFIIY